MGLEGGRAVKMRPKSSKQEMMDKNHSSSGGSLGWCFPSIKGDFPLKHPDETSTPRIAARRIAARSFPAPLLCPTSFLTLSAMAFSISD